MKKYIGSLAVLISGFAFSQSILNASSPDEFRKMRELKVEKVGDSTISTKREPLKYGFVEDKDIAKSVMVWEIIDMNDKINQPFYYNDDRLSGNSKSLYQILLDGALSGSIKEMYDDENFSTKIDAEGIKRKLESTTTDDFLIDIINSGRKPTEEEIKRGTDHHVTGSERVKVLKIMGMWFIDKRDGQMKYRPLGIAAMGPDPAMAGKTAPDGTPLQGADELVDLFWIYYPDAREILANNFVFNRKNSSADLSFDDLINMRRFSSVIYKSDAGLGNGIVKDYIPKNAEEQIEESDRIKGEILQMENDMWNY